jgi:hypothetical protein
MRPCFKLDSDRQILRLNEKVVADVLGDSFVHFFFFSCSLYALSMLGALKR